MSDGHRARRACRRAAAVDGDLPDSMQNRRALYVACFLHDIGKGRKEDHSIVGARIARKLVSAPRIDASRNGDLSPGSSQHHLTMSNFAHIARYFRSQDDPRLCQYRAKPGAAEAASRSDVRRYHGRRAWRLERLEGAVAAHALSRNGAAGRRRAYANSAKRAHRTGASCVTQCLVGLAGARRSTPSSTAIIANYWLRTDLATQVDACAGCSRAPRRVATKLADDGARRMSFTAITRADDLRAKPCAASGTFCRVVRSGRRQYRGRAHYDDPRRVCARYVPAHP